MAKKAAQSGPQALCPAGTSVPMEEGLSSWGHGKEALQFLEGGDPDGHPNMAGGFCESGSGGILKCMDGTR